MNLHRFPAGLPRAVEWPLTFVLLIAVLPLLLGAALVVALSSPGSVFFRQRRAGYHGRPFVLFKLRTMTTGDPGPQVTAEGDQRVTRVGRVLRRLKIDELPQLVNVLRGELALVGPRPEVPALVDGEDTLWQAVLSVRPGITDPVSLALRREEELLAGASDPEEFYRRALLPWKLRQQVTYLERRSATTDLRVLCRTVAAMFGWAPLRRSKPPGEPPPQNI